MEYEMATEIVRRFDNLEEIDAYLGVPDRGCSRQELATALATIWRSPSQVLPAPPNRIFVDIADPEPELLEAVEEILGESVWDPAEAEA